jgi:hypothetical protein
VLSAGGYTRDDGDLQTARPDASGNLEASRTFESSPAWWLERIPATAKIDSAAVNRAEIRSNWSETGHKPGAINHPPQEVPLKHAENNEAL